MKAIFNFIKRLWNAFTSIPELTKEEIEDPESDQGKNRKRSKY